MEDTMPKFIEARLSDRAHEYFGGDVQRYHIERDDGPSVRAYRLYQVPHRGSTRECAVVFAATAREARREFNKMARYSDTDHA
jgi:hypothetical protein